MFNYAPPTKPQSPKNKNLVEGNAMPANNWAPEADSPFLNSSLPDESPAPISAVIDPNAYAFDSVDSKSNVLNSDVRIVGQVRFSDELLMDGSVEGEIISDGILTVGENAVIKAKTKGGTTIRTQSAYIRGKVTGNVEVQDLVELAANSQLIGNIIAARLVIQDGAAFIGSSMVRGAHSNLDLSDFEEETKASAAKIATSSSNILKGDDLLA